MIRFSRKNFIPVLFLLLIVPAVATSEAPPEKRQRIEFFYVIKIQDSPVGIAKEVWKTQEEGRYYNFFTKIELSRLGTPFNLVFTQEGLESLRGKPKWFRSEINVSDMGTVVRGEVRGDTIYLKSEGLGFSENFRIPWEGDGLGGGSVDWEVRKRLEAGEKAFSLKYFNTETMSFETLRIQRKETVEDTIGGVAGEYLRIEQYEGDGDVPISVEFLDTDFFPAKVITHQMSMVIAIERVTSDMAEDIELDPEFDVIRASLIPLPGFPEAPERIRDVTLRLLFSNPPSEPKEFNAPNQKVLRREGNNIDLFLTRRTVHKMSLADEEKAVFLEPNRYIQSAHPKIRSIVEAIISETGKEGWALALQLAKWVQDYIEIKDFGLGFASALEVLQSREGDCTEHAVLLVSLLRAAGIPARLVSGFAYGNGSLFGHMWVEAHVDYWRTLDALNMNLDPIRIRFSASKGRDPFGLAEMANDYARVAGLRVEVLTYSLIEE